MVKRIEGMIQHRIQQNKMSKVNMNHLGDALDEYFKKEAEKLMRKRYGQTGSQ
jgi:hypothetical protein